MVNSSTMSRQEKFDALAHAFDGWRKELNAEFLLISGSTYTGTSYEPILVLWQSRMIRPNRTGLAAFLFAVGVWLLGYSESLVRTPNPENPAHTAGQLVDVMKRRLHQMKFFDLSFEIGIIVLALGGTASSSWKNEFCSRMEAIFFIGPR